MSYANGINFLFSQILLFENIVLIVAQRLPWNALYYDHFGQDRLFDFICFKVLTNFNFF